MGNQPQTNYITDNTQIDALKKQILEIQQQSQANQQDLERVFAQIVEHNNQQLALEEKKLEDFKEWRAKELEEHGATLHQMKIDILARLEQETRQIQAYHQEMRVKLQKIRADELHHHQMLQNRMLDAQRHHEIQTQQEHLKIQESALNSVKAYRNAMQEVEMNQKQRDQDLHQLFDLKTQADGIINGMLENLQISQNHSRKVLADSQSQLQAILSNYSEEQRALRSQALEDAKRMVLLSQQAESLSKQSFVSSDTSNENLKFARLLLKPHMVGVSDAGVEICCKKYASKNQRFQASFQGLLDSVKTAEQASSANGPFVLGTGCSEVCPLIAFLQGSVTDNGRSGECFGQEESQHNKVTYQFCFDQNDPSKMKVVSFAPHVANN